MQQVKYKDLEQQMAADGFITSAAYAQKYNLTRSQLDSRMHTGKLDYKKSGRWYFVKEDKAPTEQSREGWLTVQEFADSCEMSLPWAYRQIDAGRVQSKTIGERLLVNPKIELVRQERELRSGKNFVYWTAKEKQQCVKFA